MTWQPLEAVARAASAATPDAGAVRQLLAKLQDVPPSQRDEGLAEVAGTLAAHDPAARLLRHLAEMADPASQVLALELAARWPPPLERSLLSVLKPLLLDRTLPVGAQFAAVVVLMQTTGKSGPGAVDLIRSLVTGLGKTQIAERLDALQQRLGKCPALAEMRDRLEAKLSVRCPRCAVQLERSEMIHHLWQQHQLVLDGQLVREPWALIEDWLAEAAERTDPDRLARCFELVQHLDPQRGLARLERLLADYGIDDGEGRPHTDSAQRTSRCPRCATPVAVAAEAAVKAINVSHGRLASVGYVVEVGDTGWRPRLQIETPEAVLYQGVEPGRRWTRRSATMLLTAPALLAALVLGLFLPRPELPVVLCCLTALLIFLYVQLRWRLEDTPLDRAVDHAWTTLTPQLHSSGFSARDATFAAGLALVSVRRGRSEQRERALDRVIHLTEKTLSHRPGILTQLAVLWRLAIEDSARLDRDPVQAVARQVSRCLEGDLPLAFADRLLANWESPWWTRGHQARLRLLVCDRAFAGGCELADLIEVGRLAPALGAVLATRQPEYLAQLRHLWSLRTAQPWERCGEAFTAFDLAGPTLVRQLEQHPDLFFYQFLPGRERGAEGPEAVLVCGRGVVLGKTLFSQPGRAFPIYPKGRDAEALSRRLDRWFDFYFEEFAPRAGQWLSRPASGLLGKLRLPEAQVCAQCRQSFLTRPGEVGIALQR